MQGVLAAAYFAGKPWTRSQCILEAAKMPSDYGSAVMYRHCDEVSFIADTQLFARDLFQEAANAKGITVDEFLKTSK